MSERKRRGRRKKCESGLENRKKISGFTDGSIDTIGDKLRFGGENDNDEINDESENVKVLSFGNIMIKKKVSENNDESIADLQKILHQKTKAKEKEECEIDIDGLIDDDIAEVNVVKNKTTKLSDFFKIPDKIPKPMKKVVIDNSDKEMHILKCYRGKVSFYPIKSEIACWWCCHTFDSIPRFFPTKYDPLRDRYKVSGNFCSWQCAKAFMLDNNKSNMSSVLTSMIKKIHGRSYIIKPAPPRQSLKIFGGKLSIEEFRNSKEELYDVCESVMIFDKDYIVKKYS